MSHAVQSRCAASYIVACPSPGTWEVDLGGVPEAVHAEVEAAVVAAQKTGVVEAVHCLCHVPQLAHCVDNHGVTGPRRPYPQTS